MIISTRRIMFFCTIIVSLFYNTSISTADIVAVILEDKKDKFSLSRDSKICGSVFDDNHKSVVKTALLKAFNYDYQTHLALAGGDAVTAMKLGHCDIHIFSSRISQLSDIPDDFFSMVKSEGGYFITFSDFREKSGPVQQCPVEKVTRNLPPVTVPLSAGNSFQAPSKVTYDFSSGGNSRCLVTRVVSTRIGNGLSALDSYVQGNVPNSSCSKRFSAWGTGIGSESDGRGIIRYHARVEFWSCITFRRFCCKGTTSFGLPKCGNLCTERGETRTGRDTFRHDIRLVPQYDRQSDKVSIRTSSSVHGQGAAHWAVNAIGAISFGTLSKWYNDTLEAEINQLHSSVPASLSGSDGSDGIDFLYRNAYFSGSGAETELIIEHYLEPDILGSNIVLGIVKQ
ncbi:MAG: hypothetical protein AAF557_26345 [Pseudomonadota bacterium]